LNATGPASLRQAALYLNAIDFANSFDVHTDLVTNSSTGGSVRMYSVNANLAGLIIGSNSTTTPNAMLDVRGAAIVTTNLKVGAPTGSPPTTGTINVSADVYKNGTAFTNPDFVFEHWATGKIVKYIEKLGAKDYKGLMPLVSLKEFVRNNYHLPGFGQHAGHGLFGGSEHLLAHIEESYLHIFSLEERIHELEERGQNENVI
jgi:hypothetical protein